MAQSKAIPYHEVKKIIMGCRSPRTRALIAFQFVMGNRAGELARDYIHTVQKMRGKGRHKHLAVIGSYKSRGIRRDGFTRTKYGLRWETPNFKNRGKTKKTGFILRDNERWLYKILVRWLRRRQGKKYLFNLRKTRIKQLIDEELKKHDESYHSHCLRHSRGTMIGELTGDPYVVQAVLGHADINTSSKYVSIAPKRIREKLGKTPFEEALGEKI